MSGFLPPLPPMGSGGGRSYRPGGRNAIELLTEGHERIRALCAELLTCTRTPRRRGQVAEVLTAVVIRHLSAEEQYVYPALRAAVPDGARLVDREVGADIAIRYALRALAATPPRERGFAVRADEVAAALRRHIDVAMREVFPPLGAVVAEADLIRLGNRIEIAEEAAPTRPHPAAPATPPWNRFVDPAVGVVDKVRDVVTGRRTYVADLSWRPPWW